MVAAYRFSNELRYRDATHPQQTQLTPKYVLSPVREALGGKIGLDPCTLADNPTEAERFYFLPMDGLQLPWDSKSIFCNPPYGKAKEPWVDRCIQSGEGGVSVILLIPAHTDTRTFQKAARSADGVVFVRGRLKFGIPRRNGRQIAASHGSALICWNADPDPLKHLGWTV